MSAMRRQNQCGSVRPKVKGAVVPLSTLRAVCLSLSLSADLNPGSMGIVHAGVLLVYSRSGLLRSGSFLFSLKMSTLC